MVFEVVDGTFSRPLVRFSGGNSDESSFKEISKNGRFVRLGVAGGDDESVDGGEEGSCWFFFRQRELYVRWTLDDINFDAWEVDARWWDSEKTRRVSLALFNCIEEPMMGRRASIIYLFQFILQVFRKVMSTDNIVFTNYVTVKSSLAFRVL